MRVSVSGLISCPAEASTASGEPDYRRTADLVKRVAEDVSWVRELPGVEITEQNRGELPRRCVGKKHLGVGEVHPVERLPEEFVGLENGHNGSHQFLVVDFLEALETGKLPPNHVWLAARFNAPGIVAHQSAITEGEHLNILDFGVPPRDAVYLDPQCLMQA